MSREFPNPAFLPASAESADDPNAGEQRHSDHESDGSASLNKQRTDAIEVRLARILSAMVQPCTYSHADDPPGNEDDSDDDRSNEALPSIARTATSAADVAPVLPFRHPASMAHHLAGCLRYLRPNAPLRGAGVRLDPPLLPRPLELCIRTCPMPPVRLRKAHPRRLRIHGRSPDTRW
jgi:hypothetical protein